MFSRKIAVISVLAATCLAIQLTPRPPNVELTSLITFVSGTVFGSIVGAFVGVLTMFINGFLSAWGTAGLILPFQMIGMGIIGTAGGAYGRMIKGKKASLCVESAILGASLTLLYDVITNIGFALAFATAGTPLPLAIISALISGIPFAIIHIVSNSILFGLLAIPAFYTLRKFMGGAYAH